MKSIVPTLIERNNKKISNVLLSFWFIGALIIILLVIGLQDCDMKLNEIGDFFAGTIGGLISLIGALFVYIGFLSQQNAVLQNELSILSSHQKIEEQNKILSSNQFESEFLTLLQLLSAYVNAFDIRKNESNRAQIYTGKDCFRFWFKEFNPNKGVRIRAIDKISKTFHDLYKLYRHDLEAYFGQVENILELIANAKSKENLDIKKYIRAFKSQFNMYELVLLFYYTLHSDGRGLRELTREFNFFSKLEKDASFLYHKDHLDDYNGDYIYEGKKK